MKNLYIGLVSLLLFCACAHEKSDIRCALLPVPKSIQQGNGFFTITNWTELDIVAPETDKEIITKQFNAWKENIPAIGNESKTNRIVLETCDRIDNITSPEGYTLDVTKEKIDIKAVSGTGLFYAMQTLAQMVANTHLQMTEKILEA